MGKVSPIEGGDATESVRDVLTEILRRGSRQLLAEALEVEIEEFLEQYRELRDTEGRRRVVRNGYLPARAIQTGIGSIPVRVPRSRDREPENGAIRFTSSILPPYLRRTKSIEDLLPWLYSEGDFDG